MENTGLGNQDKKTWPKLSDKEAQLAPIDRLRPGSQLHADVLTYLLKRVDESSKAMGTFYARWAVNEKKYQAYIDLPKWEETLKQMNNTGQVPAVVSITVPYSFATISTIVTYLIHTFCGRRPIFQITATRKEAIEAAGNMETMIQYNADHVKLIKQLFQFLTDGQVYGISAMRCQWKEERKLRTVWQTTTNMAFGGQVTSEKTKVREQRVTFQGNDIASIDPFLFFPDPKVPMSEVSRRGEYVFWRSFEGKHILLAEQAAGRVKWVDNIPSMPSSRGDGSSYAGDSSRALVSKGDPTPGSGNRGESHTAQPAQIDQGTIMIIPAELGLGKGTAPERWIFSIANRGQIIQAQPLDLDHDRHPVVVSEPYTMGYGFGHAGMSDYIGPFQDTLSWFINSHMDNVKTALNNMWLVDPSRVELQDLKRPGPGKIIRLKRAAYGQNVETAVQQLGVHDVTSNHPKDFELFTRMADSLSSVSDNLRGLQDSGSRKTATEVRTTGEAAASRLAAVARLISAQALTDLAEQMALNYQQNMTEEFYLQVVGQEGLKAPIQITPEMVCGDFNFPVHDGTLPMDKVAMLDVWKEIMMGVAQDPELRQGYSLAKIFEYVAELGGAKNISTFKLDVQAAPDAMVAAAAQAGNALPVGQTPGVQPNPGERLAGGL